jgi:hypothetical protein
VIEVKYDDFPAETGWTFRDSASTLISGQSTGCFSTEGGAVSSFRMTDTYTEAAVGAGDFKITVNGEPGAISSSGRFRHVVRESFDVVWRNTGPTVDYRLDVASDGYPYEMS